MFVGDRDHRARQPRGHRMHDAIALIDLPAVKKITALSRSTIYAKIKRGSFPAPAKIGRASRWSRKEIVDWIGTQLADRAALLAA